MEWTNAELRKQPERVRTGAIAGLVGLIAVQIAMLVILNVCKFEYHFADRNALPSYLLTVFIYTYLFALLFGSCIAFWGFHWLIGVAQILTPILLYSWMSGVFYMFIHGPP